MLYAWIVLAIILLPVQLFVTAPYGRHATSTWSPTVSNKLAWVIMESAALFGMLIMLALHHPTSSVAWLAAGLWTLHYINRALIYPLRIRTAGKRMPLVVMLMALIFNAVNSFINGNYQIPRGGLFEHVSCANFLGEIIEWLGFAILCWNLPAVAFALWTAANLIPRAIAHHRWYLDQFADYPPGRKAIIPYVL